MTNPNFNTILAEALAREKNVQTNGDHIRGMTDEELASFIALQQVSVINEFCKKFDCQAPDIAAAATAETLAWLKSPAEAWEEEDDDDKK